MRPSRTAQQRVKAWSCVPTVFLVNVGQSSDGRVSSVEPAVLIHNTVLQMARTVNRVPWVLTTVLTQQYPYGAYPAREMAVVWSDTSVSPVAYSWRGCEIKVQECSSSNTGGGGGGGSRRLHAAAQQAERFIKRADRA